MRYIKNDILIEYYNNYYITLFLMSVITFIDFKNICWHIYRKRQTITRVKYAFINIIKRLIDLQKCNTLLFIREGSKKYRWQNFSKPVYKKKTSEKEDFYMIYNELLNNVIPYYNKSMKILVRLRFYRIINVKQMILLVCLHYIIHIMELQNYILYQMIKIFISW